MLRVQSLSKTYSVARSSVRPGVENVCIDVPKGSFFTLLGPSGCGKTTTLRCVAGLEYPDRGIIAIGEDIVFDSTQAIEIPVNQRDIGMVFQSYAIWPHMSVLENVTFPLTVSRRRRYAAAEIKRRAANVLEAVGLGNLGQRSATQLSGGQQQRLALARAIIHEPSLLLLDEPLSNLDVKLREDMRIELKRLQQQVGITAIYVTHDQSEALAMSDMVAVMESGTIMQVGTPHEIYHAPANRFVASFIGATNLLDGFVMAAASEPGLVAVKVFDRFVVECPVRGPKPSAGASITVSVRPEIIRLELASGDGDPDEPNVLQGRVATRTFLGGTTLYHVRVADHLVQVAGTGDADFAPSAFVSLTLPAAKVLALPAKD